jgi:SAM-dependent methyltransferase
MGAIETAAPIYMMGRTDAETARLIRQSRIVGAASRQMLAEAGLAAGMRVLDIGSGAGDLALAAAELVGPGGAVVGVDTNPAVLGTARARAEAGGHANVHFVAGDLHTAALAGPFDAVVGRFVLMYLPDPAAALRHLASLLRPGGLATFQEYNLHPESVQCLPAQPLWAQVWAWLGTATERAGVECRMGFRLREVFEAAGLTSPRLRLACEVGGGADWHGYAYVADALRSLLPLVERFGVATAEEVAIDTLAARLRAETLACGGTVKLPDLVGAWARAA